MECGVKHRNGCFMIDVFIYVAAFTLCDGVAMLFVEYVCFCPLRLMLFESNYNVL